MDISYSFDEQSILDKIDEKLAAEISLKKPAVSNSRLGVHSVHPQNPKLSFDAMTIVGNLSRDNAQNP